VRARPSWRQVLPAGEYVAGQGFIARTNNKEEEEMMGGKGGKQRPKGFASHLVLLHGTPL